MSDTPDQIEAVSERGTFRVSKSCETHSGWRLVNVSTAPDGMDSAEVWKCPRCLQEELERKDERIRDLQIKLDVAESCGRSFDEKQPFCEHENRYTFTEDGGKTGKCVMCENARLHAEALPCPWPGCLEVCICAAIKMPDGEVIRGHRHDGCYAVVRARLDAAFPLDGPHGPEREAARLQIIDAKQGFVTSKNRFVDRKEGMRLQLATGLPSKWRTDGKWSGDDLFSEDLY